MKKTLKINNTLIGPNNPPYITFEAGPTHNGFVSARNLIEKAAESGADAIKFQIINADKLISNKNQLFTYQILKKDGGLETVRESIYTILKRRSLKDDQWESLKKFADKKRIAFFATVGFPEEIDFLKEIGCESIKIASADLNHYPLLEAAAKSGLTIQIDTGMSTIKEVKKAVEILLKNKNDKILIHHCPSGYPAKIENINLNIINTLKKEFDCPVGFSDHSPGSSTDIAAVALGADLIEKTITKSRYTTSIEHMFSLELNELNEFVKTVKNIKKSFGKKYRVINNIENNNRIMSRRSIFLSKNAKKGTYIKDCELIFRRPGNGISVDSLEKIKDKKLKRNMKKFEILTKRDLV